MAGYSKTPLIKKLGIKSGLKVCIVDPPDNFMAALGELPDNVELIAEVGGLLDYIHFFTTTRAVLERTFPRLKQALGPNGALWISWPKKAAKVETDLDGNIVREIGLGHDLVDIKVAAVDEIWSGLKFVYRLQDRK